MDSAESSGASPCASTRCRAPVESAGWSSVRSYLLPSRSASWRIGTLDSAFEDDPVERWLYPDDAEYRLHFPAFVAAFGGDAFRDQTVWRLGGFDVVAFWFRPGREPDGDAVVRVLMDTTAEHLHADSFATLEQMAEGHPDGQHWYLPWFGVNRALQGQRLGTQLMRHCLEIVDESGYPAYLETPNPRTVPFYERTGFCVTGVAQQDSARRLR